jgi:hypothetical protein
LEIEPYTLGNKKHFRTSTTFSLIKAKIASKQQQLFAKHRQIVILIKSRNLKKFVVKRRRNLSYLDLLKSISAVKSVRKFVGTFNCSEKQKEN